jgi:ribosomal protein S17
MNTTNPRILSGIVTSDRADKTITVKIEKSKTSFIWKSYEEGD